MPLMWLANVLLDRNPLASADDPPSTLSHCDLACKGAQLIIRFDRSRFLWVGKHNNHGAANSPGIFFQRVASSLLNFRSFAHLIKLSLACISTDPSVGTVLHAHAHHGGRGKKEVAKSDGM